MPWLFLRPFCFQPSSPLTAIGIAPHTQSPQRPMPVPMRNALSGNPTLTPRVLPPS
jgi:hypothetical protein